MIYIESESKDPYFNLAFEEYVFNNLDPEEEYFMLWQNDNAIVVGKYQNTAEEINSEFVSKNHIKVVRRLSGGGAVYHDKGNLNFTFIVNEDRNPEYDFKIFIQPVIDALASFGIEAKFTGRNDITINDKKFCGNSQYSKSHRIMHHGCIMVNSNLVNVNDALRPPDIKYISKAIKSVRSRVTTINENSEKNITVEEFKDALKREVLNGNAVNVYKLSEHDYSEINRLVAEKYSTWDWNYGKSSTFETKTKVKYSFGLVEIHLTVKEGIVERIKFSGDFFGNGEISELENAISGLRLDENFAYKLSDIVDVSYYINGMKAEDIQKQVL